MKDLSESQKRELLDEVRREFPYDEMMQEIHYVRLLLYHQTKDLTSAERIKFYQQAGKKRPVKKGVSANRKPVKKVVKVTTVAGK